jgi:general stress protein CsbA
MPAKFLEKIEDRLYLILTILFLLALGSISRDYFASRWLVAILGVSFFAFLVIKVAILLAEHLEKQPPDHNSTEK